MTKTTRKQTKTQTWWFNQRGKKWLPIFVITFSVVHISRNVRGNKSGFYLIQGRLCQW